MLTFDADKHEYKWDGVVVPSVTQILRPLADFSAIPPDVLETARQRGVAVHAAVALEIAEDLDWHSLDEAIVGYVEAWCAFRDNMHLHGADFGHIETPVYCLAYGYAGTPDLTAFIDGEWAVIDIKTAANVRPEWALQTAAYRAALNGKTKTLERMVKNRYSLRLAADGSYRLDQHKDKSDFAVFLAALTMHKWRAANAG